MIKGLFQEKKEYYFSLFNTKEGLFEFLISSLVWGFVMINYVPLIYQKILNILNLSPFFETWLAYIILGIILVPIGMTITFILTRIFKFLFKNGRIIR